MAATGEMIGNLLTLAYESTTGVWKELAGFANDDALSLSTGEAETTSHGTLARTYIPGLTDGEYSFTAMFNDDATLTSAGKPQDLLMGLQLSRAVKAWRVRPQGSGASKPEYLFSAFVTGFDANLSNDDDPISADVTLKISGAVTSAAQS